MEDLTNKITVEVTVNEIIEKIWKLWTTPADISQWNNSSDDWHSTRVENDLKDGGHFLFRMETKDGKVGFDHCGKYDKILVNQLIEYTVSDGRKSIISFKPVGNNTTIIETFEPEKETTIELQRDFCHSILKNFKKYAENKND